MAEQPKLNKTKFFRQRIEQAIEEWYTETGEHQSDYILILHRSHFEDDIANPISTLLHIDSLGSNYMTLRGMIERTRDYFAEEPDYERDEDDE